MNNNTKPAIVYAGITIVACVTVILIWIYIQNISNGITNVQQGWVSYEQEASQRTALLSDLYTVIGYGGFIHNFKNYILRGIEKSPGLVELDQRHIISTIERFRKLSLTNKEEDALNHVETTFRVYFDMFRIAKAEISKGRSPRTVDALVKVDDSAALMALKALTIEVVEKGRDLSKDTDAAILDTNRTVKQGILLIPLLLISSLLFGLLYRRSQITQDKAQLATEQLNAVLEANPDVIIVSNEQGDITRTNNKIEDLLGYTRDEILTMNIESLVPDNLRENHHMKRALFFSERNSRLMGEGVNILARRKNGSEVNVDIALGSYKSHGTTYAVASMRDITNQREIEMQFLIAKEQAESYTIAKSDFLANMSHELRTPLNAIIGFSEALLTNSFGTFSNIKHKEYVTHVYDSGKHLLTLINDILDMSKVEAGKLDLLEENVNISEITDTCINMVKTRANNAGVILSRNMSDLPIMLWADSTRMKQILLNILSNAIKFTDIGGTITISSQVNNDSLFTLTIVDQGVGMDKREIETALEPFGQVSSIQNRNIDGTGLGLPLTKALAELHGGSLRLVSEKGKGTTVTILLPAERVLSKGTEN